MKFFLLHNGYHRLCVLLRIKNLLNKKLSIVINFISLVHSNIKHLAIIVSHICVYLHIAIICDYKISEVYLSSLSKVSAHPLVLQCVMVGLLHSLVI